ncbi:MAG: hypothetical protein FJ029_03690 [Actinobacteria bacterium]|nr:hypothetical protein [Actinomycetota bacterium]
MPVSYRLAANPARTDCLSMILPEDVYEQDGIAWRLEPGQPDHANPLIEPAMPWDSGAVFSHGTVLRDPIDGGWKAWIICTPMEAGHFENYRRLTYFTSKDGVHWERPLLELCPQPGYPKTNILFDFDSGGISMYPSVLIDPNAPAQRRYEMFVMRSPGRPEGIGSPVIPGLPLGPGQRTHPFGVYRYFSADGIRWTIAEGPLLQTATLGMRMVAPYSNPDRSADQTYVYREPDGSYVAVHKIGEPMHPGGHVPYDIFPIGRRVLARRTSPDGSAWSPYEVVLQPDWQDPQDLQFMEMAPLRVRGGWLGIVACYHNLTQTIDLQLAGSPDQRMWYRPVRLPALPVAPLGDYGGGMIWPTHHPIEADGRVYLYYGALEGIHGDPAAGHPTLWPFHGALCRVSWAKDRYWAAAAGAGGAWTGRLMTYPLPVGGKRLAVNAATSTVAPGILKAELVNPDGTPIPGFGLDDYVPWHGDSTRVHLRWKGGDACPRPEGAARFHLTRARLYGFAWE